MEKINKNNKNYKTINILNVKVDFINASKALSEVENWIDTNKKYQITTPNPEQIILAQKDYRFRKMINDSTLRIADGVGLVWAARWLGRQPGSLRANSNCAEIDTSFCLRSLRSGDRNLLGFRIVRRIKSKLSILSSALANIRKPSQICFPSREHSSTKTKQKLQRLTGIDLMMVMCQLAAKKNWRVFLLGGKDGVAKKAAEQLFINHKSLIINHYCGAADIKNETQEEKEETIAQINKFRPHLLFVAYGAPWQEKWIYDNLSRLNVNAAMGVGGAFDYLAARVKRAPLWLRKAGLEWFWRLFHQPWRFGRQLALAKFIWQVISYKM